MRVYELKSPDEINARLDEIRTEMLAEIDGLTEEQSRFSPSETEWSINEVCRHVSRSLTGVGGLCAMLASGTSPPNTGKPKMGALNDDRDDFGEIRETVVQGYDVISQSTANLNNDPDLSVTFAHPWFGPKNAHQWAAFNILHMEVHLSQIRRIKNSEGYSH